MCTMNNNVCDFIHYYELAETLTMDGRQISIMTMKWKMYFIIMNSIYLCT